MGTVWLLAIIGLVFLQCQHLLAYADDVTDVTRPKCIKDCSKMKDGDYQSCASCLVFVKCTNHRMFEMPCPATLKWDDKLKRCVKHSSTCRQAYSVDEEEGDDDWTNVIYDNDVTRHPCIKDCKNKKDGKYKSCTGCHYYTQCSKGRKSQVACPGKLEWDNRMKKCVKKSSTCKHDIVTDKPGKCPSLSGPCRKICLVDSDCPESFKCCAVSGGCGYMCVPPQGSGGDEVELDVSFDENVDVAVLDAQMEQVRLTHTPKGKRCKSTGRRCVSDCTGKKDGDYQSCRGCDVYVSCVAGLRYDDRPCAPGGLVWDDNKKRCEYNSTTCDGCSYPRPCKGTGPCCVTSCKGLPNGNYQSCRGCNVFVSCSNGRLYDKRPCAPRGTVWDDNKKLCDWYSNTCHHCRGEY